MPGAVGVALVRFRDEVASPAPDRSGGRAGAGSSGPGRAPHEATRRFRPLKTKPTLAATVGLVVVHLALQGRVEGPWLPDEVAYLSGAETLTGGSPALLHDLPYYRWGYSVVLAPLEALPVGSAGRFWAVTVVNAVLLAAVYPLVRALLVQVTAATPRQASLAALLAALQPVVWVYGGFALSEPLLLALVPAWLLGVHSSVTRASPSPWFVVSTLALYATHDRLVVALVPAAWLLVDLARRHPSARPRVLGAGAALALGVVATHVVDRWMEGVRWSLVAIPEAAAGGPLALVVDPSRWDDLTGRTIGHAWQLVASGGVPLVVAIVIAGADVRSRAGRGGRPSRDRAAAAVVRSALALLAGLAVESVVFLALAGTRPDHFVYGRYAEIALPPVMGLGVVAILRGHDAVALAARATAVAVTVLAVALATLPWTEVLRDQRVPVLHAPSLALLTDGTGPLHIARVTVVVVALAALVAGWARWRPTASERPPLALVGLGPAGDVGARSSAPSPVVGRQTTRGELTGGATRRSTRRPPEAEPSGDPGPIRSHPRTALALLAVWILSLTALDLARSASVLSDSRRGHAHAAARR